MSLVPSPPSQIFSLAVRITQGSGIHHVNRISPGLLRVVRTASNNICGGGLGMRLHISMVVPHKGVLCGHSVQVSRSFSWGGGCPVVPRWEEEYRFISEEPGAGEGQCSHHNGQESIIVILLRTQDRSSRSGLVLFPVLIPCTAIVTCRTCHV